MQPKLHLMELLYVSFDSTVLYCILLCSTVLYCILLCSNVLRCCAALCCVALRCTVLFYIAMAFVALCLYIRKSARKLKNIRIIYMNRRIYPAPMYFIYLLTQQWVLKRFSRTTVSRRAKWTRRRQSKWSDLNSVFTLIYLQYFKFQIGLRHLNTQTKYI